MPTASNGKVLLRVRPRGFCAGVVRAVDIVELAGRSGKAPDRPMCVAPAPAVDALSVDDPQKLSFLTQTTLSLYDTQEIVARLRKKFPLIQGPASDDICYATQNRQEAVEQVA